MRSYILAAIAACALAAGPAAAASSFFTSISEGQYQVISLKYDGPPPATINGFTTTYIYAQQPGQFRTLWDIFYTMPSCALADPGATNCAMFPATVKAVAWDNYINLYIEFTHHSVDNCAIIPSNTCALEYRPIEVSLPGVFGENEFTVLSSGGGAVPEPATWAMMIAGFGLVGGALRRRKLEIA
jgi:hypothetical protein